MADKVTVTFSYSVGSASFNTETEVDQEEWSNMDHQDRVELLFDAATDDVENQLEIDESSIDDANES